ncbi:MAG: DUF6350 family protein [Cellulomonadaceae bacterium]|jgi:hypothetical protein|nr:DUF6350 family protein [Cellulomonadaceae bacterium]
MRQPPKPRVQQRTGPAAPKPTPRSKPSSNAPAPTPAETTSTRQRETPAKPGTNQKSRTKQTTSPVDRRAIRARTIEESRPNTGALRVTAARVAPALSGLWAVAQGIILSYAFVLFIAMIAMLAAGSAEDAGIPWAQATATAGGIWLLGHGVPLTLGEATVTLIPLGVTILSLFALYASAKRTALATVSTLITASVVYSGATTVGAVLAGTHGTGLAIAAGGGLVMGASGTALGILSQPEAPRLKDLSNAALWWMPRSVRLGIRAGAMVAVMVLACSAALVAIWGMVGRETSGEIVRALEPGWVGGILLAVTQIAIIPNLVIWASSWIAGPGFVLGTGTLHSSHQVIDGPLPALPILGALPPDAWASVWAQWVPAIVIACGVGAGWFVWRRLHADGSYTRILNLISAWLGLMASVFALSVAAHWLASGAAGAGRLLDVGTDAIVVAGTLTMLCGIGAFALLLVMRIMHRPAQPELPAMTVRLAAAAERLSVR